MFNSIRRFVHSDVGTAPLLLLGFISVTICIAEFHNITVSYPFSILVWLMFSLSVISLWTIGRTVDRSRTKVEGVF